MSDDNRHDVTESLFATVERIRRERFPDLDADLVRSIMELHSDPEAPPPGLMRAVEDAIANACKEAS